MNKTIIGFLFILAGVCYGSLALDDIYDHTIGWLVKNNWLKPPVQKPGEQPPLLGRKPTILLYSFGLIIIGAFILWTRNS